MSWNHRIIRTQEGELEFCEAHYDENGQMTGYTKPFICGDNIEEMRTLAARLLKACDQPIIESWKAEEP